MTHHLRSGDESSHVSDAAIKAVSVAMPVPLSSVFEVTGLDRTITRLKEPDRLALTAPALTLPAYC
jgi:hypothetical protein